MLAGIWYKLVYEKGKANQVIEGFVDSDYAQDKIDRKSTH